MEDWKGHPPRLADWDYSTPSAYFVTFKVLDRQPCLGALQAGRMDLSPAGAIVERCRQRLPENHPVRLDVSVIMPDHVHAILVLNGPQPGGSDGSASRGLSPMMRDPSATLGKVVRAWKAAATHEIRRSGLPDFSWQSRFYEHIIRTRPELERVRAYIRTNPQRALRRVE
jgi:putative transposase